MKFEDLLAWQGSRQLVQAIYKLTAIEKLNKDFGLINQIQRSTVSIMSNIAEDFERRSFKKKDNFIIEQELPAVKQAAEYYNEISIAYLLTPNF